MDMFQSVRVWEKLRIIVTPQELRQILGDLHHVSLNGVHKGYTESDPEQLFQGYASLYERLKNGDQLDWKQDHQTVFLQTGLTGNLSSCAYKNTNKLCVPDFSEPCAFAETFCLVLQRGQLSAAGWVGQFPENTVGICIGVPKKVEFSDGTKTLEELADHQAYERLILRIKSLTKPLKLQIGEKIYRPSVRVSQQAKGDLQRFWFVVAHEALVL